LNNIEFASKIGGPGTKQVDHSFVSNPGNMSYTSNNIYVEDEFKRVDDEQEESVELQRQNSTFDVQNYN
jgi:hypothetical protein